MELALVVKKHIKRARAQTVLAEFPGPPVLLGGSQGVQRNAASQMNGSGEIAIPHCKSCPLFRLLLLPLREKAGMGRNVFSLAPHAGRGPG